MIGRRGRSASGVALALASASMIETPSSSPGRSSSAEARALTRAAASCSAERALSSKYRTAAASADSGALNTPTITRATIPAPVPAEAATASMMFPAAPTSTTRIMITANTCSPFPRTSRRLRRSAGNTPGFSITTTGAATDHSVSRIRPGITSRMKPAMIPIAATTPTRISWPSTGAAARRSFPAVASRRPSWTSATSLTTIPVNSVAATR